MQKRLKAESLQEAERPELCRRSGAEGQGWAGPSQRWEERVMQKQKQQPALNGLEGNRQPHFLSWGGRWEGQHRHARAPCRLKMVELRKKRHLKRSMMRKWKWRESNRHSHHPPFHTLHYKMMHSSCSPPHQSLHGSDQFPWKPPQLRSSILSIYHYEFSRGENKKPPQRLENLMDNTWRKWGWEDEQSSGYWRSCHKVKK